MASTELTMSKTAKFRAKNKCYLEIKMSIIWRKMKLRVEKYFL